VIFGPTQRFGLQLAAGGLLEADNASQELLRWGVKAFALFRSGEDPERDVAATVGKQAAKIGMTEKELSSWLQGAYSTLWVKQTNLKPRYDMKDIRKFVLSAYNKVPK